jgi:hypothetical protein
MSSLTNTNIFSVALAADSENNWLVVLRVFEQPYLGAIKDF